VSLAKERIKDVLKSHAGTLGAGLTNALLMMLSAISSEAFGDLDGDGIPNFLDKNDDRKSEENS
jgi:hypothetical protein